MKKIDEINRDTENKVTVAIIAIVINLVLGTAIWQFCQVNYTNIISLENKYPILLTPIAVIITLMIHEAIHVMLFKFYGRGKAVVKVKWVKEEGSIVVQQLNEQIMYSKSDIIKTLISPFLIITLLSLVLIRTTTVPLLFYINCILNMAGSSTDIFITLKLFTKYSSDIKVKFTYCDKINMCIYEK